MRDSLKTISVRPKDEDSTNRVITYVEQMQSRVADGGLRSATARPELTRCPARSRYEVDRRSMEQSHRVRHSSLFAYDEPSSKPGEQGESNEPSVDRVARLLDYSGGIVFCLIAFVHMQYLAVTAVYRAWMHIGSYLCALVCTSRAHAGGLRSATARPELASPSKGKSSSGACVSNSDTQGQNTSQARDGGLRLATARGELDMQFLYTGFASGTPEIEVIACAAWQYLGKSRLYQAYVCVWWYLGTLVDRILRGGIAVFSNGPRSATERPRLVDERRLVAQHEKLAVLYKLKERLSVDSALVWVAPEATEMMGYLVGNRQRDVQHLEAGWQLYQIPRDRCGTTRHTTEKDKQVAPPPGLRTTEHDSAICAVCQGGNGWCGCSRKAATTTAATPSGEAVHASTLQFTGGESQSDYGAAAEQRKRKSAQNEQRSDASQIPVADVIQDGNHERITWLEVCSAIQDALETGALESFERIEALSSVRLGWEKRKWQEVQDINSWAAVKAQMELMAYCMENEATHGSA